MTRFVIEVCYSYHIGFAPSEALDQEKGLGIMKKHLGRVLAAVFVLGLIAPLSVTSYAEETEEINVSRIGTVYTFDGETEYSFSDVEGEPATQENTLGVFSINGDLEEVLGEREGVLSYVVNSDEAVFSYTWDPSVLDREAEEWCITNDKSKVIDDISLSSKIRGGAVVVQYWNGETRTWETTSRAEFTDVFTEGSSFSEDFYTVNDVQLRVGYLYRVVVAYQMRRQTGTRDFLFIHRPVYEYQRTAEVYEFYLSNEEVGGTPSPNDGPRRVYTSGLGSGEYARFMYRDNGFSEEREFNADNAHYGWSLGDFVINGYTDYVENEDGSIVYLKNVGDRVTLWFILAQNINRLNNDEGISIVADEDGYDEAFQTLPSDFGRGALLIRYTDPEGSSRVITYTDFLEACGSVGAETRVQLFEEGDYEVHLNYEISSERSLGPIPSQITEHILPERINDYQTAFTFSVRNGNTMVFPMDAETGSELENNDLTENGFTIDTAGSRYLDVTVQRAAVSQASDGTIVLGTRRAAASNDGCVYTDEGVYTITIRSDYTDEIVTKTIYVGNDALIRLLANTGLTVEQINDRIANGATISEDGELVYPEVIDVETAN